MTTIEERAKKNSAILSIKFGMNEKMAHALYVAASKEQSKIDIDKACEWLEKNLGYYNRNEVHIGKSYEQCVIDDFRKALEE